MQKVVYSVLDEGELVNELLHKEGYEVIVGDGRMDAAALERCHALIPGKCPVTEAELAGAPNLVIVSKFGVGVDKIDIPACTRHHVIVTNTAMTNYIAVAEHTIALMLAAAKRLYPVSRVFHTQQPDWEAAKGFVSTELYGKTLSVIGLGNIGRRVAALAHAFEMTIVGFDPYADFSKIPDYVERADTLDEALERADFLTLHVAGGPAVRGMIGRQQLEKLRPHAVLINTTRGFVVDEPALIEALEQHRIAGAALDVFLQEPLTEPNPLLTMDQVIATPHNAASTPEARLRSQKQCAENIIRALNGQRPDFALN